MKKGWKIASLGDVCQVIGGGTPSKNCHEYFIGNIPWATVRDMKSDVISETEFKITDDAVKNSATNIIPRGNVVIATRVGLGKVCLLEKDTAINQDLRGIVPVKPDTLSTRFLFLWLKSIAHKIVDEGTGATVQGVKLPFVKSLQIPLPPLPEQRRIVGILEEAFDAIAKAKANAEKNLQNARELFESHLNEVFSQRGKGCVERQLSSLCKEITVGYVGSMAKKYKGNGIPFLRSQNVRPFEIWLENIVFIDKEFHGLLNKSRLRPGDLAIVRTGYPGTAAVVPPELPDANCSDLVIVRPGKEVNPHFLAAFFNSSYGKRHVLGRLVGAAQKHFNVTAAKEVMLHVPTLTEQRVIINKIDCFRIETQHLESIYQRKLTALEEFKKSILHQAFSGAL